MWCMCSYISIEEDWHDSCMVELATNLKFVGFLNKTTRGISPWGIAPEQLRKQWKIWLERIAAANMEWQPLSSVETSWNAFWAELTGDLKLAVVGQASPRVWFSDIPALSTWLYTYCTTLAHKTRLHLAYINLPRWRPWKRCMSAPSGITFLIFSFIPCLSIETIIFLFLLFLVFLLLRIQPFIIFLSLDRDLLLWFTLCAQGSCLLFGLCLRLSCVLGLSFFGFHTSKKLRYMWLKFDAKDTQVCFSNLIKCENLEMHGGHETARWLPHLWHWFLQPVALRTLFWLLTHAAQFALATWLWLERAPQRTFCNSPSAWSAHPWGSLWRPNHWAWEAGFFLSGCDLLPTSISASNTRIYIYIYTCVYIYICVCT